MTTTKPSAKAKPEPGEPDSELSGEEMFEDLNGFEEIAIARAFGTEITTLAETKPITMLRALVFAHKRRGGATDADAKKAAMELSIKAVQEYFTEEPDEVMPEDPASAVGKDDELPG